MEVGTPVEIKPGISPSVFGGGGVLTRDEYGIQDYQTNIANIEAIGPTDSLPAGTVMIRHGDSYSMYSIQHIRPYDPDNNNNNQTNNENPIQINRTNQINNNPRVLNGGKRRKTRKLKRKQRTRK
jgi:hypothetical protein